MCIIYVHGSLWVHKIRWTTAGSKCLSLFATMCLHIYPELVCSVKPDCVQLLNCWIYDIESGSNKYMIRVKLLWVDEDDTDSVSAPDFQSSVVQKYLPHRHWNRSGWSGHGLTILMRHNYAFNFCVVLFPDWIAAINPAGYIHKCTHIRLAFSVVKLREQGNGNPHFEAEVQWECLLTAK